ncbi:hypothetical protein GQ42DRAFT_163199, partial [Ramicandelaber brevisporus]
MRQVPPIAEPHRRQVSLYRRSGLFSLTGGFGGFGGSSSGSGFLSGSQHSGGSGGGSDVSLHGGSNHSGSPVNGYVPLFAIKPSLRRSGSRPTSAALGSFSGSHLTMSPSSSGSGGSGSGGGGGGGGYGSPTKSALMSRNRNEHLSARQSRVTFEDRLISSPPDNTGDLHQSSTSTNQVPNETNESDPAADRPHIPSLHGSLSPRTSKRDISANKSPATTTSANTPADTSLPSDSQSNSQLTTAIHPTLAPGTPTFGEQSNNSAIAKRISTPVVSTEDTPAPEVPPSNIWKQFLLTKLEETDGDILSRYATQFNNRAVSMLDMLVDSGTLDEKSDEELLEIIDDISRISQN